MLELVRQAMQDFLGDRVRDPDASIRMVTCIEVCDRVVIVGEVASVVDRGLEVVVVLQLRVLIALLRPSSILSTSVEPDLSALVCAQLP